MKRFLLSMFITLFVLNVLAVDHDKMYIVGDAVSSWSLNDAVEMNKKINGDFDWFGKMYGEKSYKFVGSQTDWAPSYNNAGDTLTYWTDYPAGDDDVNFWVGEGGYYLVDLRLSDSETVAFKLSGIYPIGNATSYSWNVDLSETMTQDVNDDFIYTWNTYLSEGDLKFLGWKDFAAVTIRPEGSGNTEVEANTTMFIKVNIASDDDKFSVPASLSGKNVTITMNLKDMTVYFDYNGNPTSIEENTNDLINEKTTYFDLLGNRIVNPGRGIYIKKTEAGTKTIIQKVYINN